MRHLQIILFIVFICPLTVLAEKPIRIGIIQSLSGSAKEDGTSVIRSVKLAEEDLKASNDIELELIIEDDTSQPKLSVSAFHSLRHREVDAIIGATWSSTTNALAPLAAKYGVVLLNTSTLPEALDYSSGDGYVFNSALPVEAEVDPFNKYLKINPLKSVVIIQNGSPWGDLQTLVYRKILDQHNVKVLHTFRGLKSENNEWQEILPRVKALNPSLILCLLAKNDIDTVVRKSRQLGVKAKIFGSKNGLDAFEQSSAKSQYNGSFCFPYPYEQLRSSQGFYDKFKARYNENPKIYTDSSYDALGILVQAVLLSRKTGEPIREVLRSTDFRGIVGNYKFSIKSSLATGKASLICIENGEPMIVDIGATL